MRTLNTVFPTGSSNYSQLFDLEEPAYTQIFPFQGCKTIINMPTWLVEMFSSQAIIQVLAALFYQGRTRRRSRPYTYMDLVYRTGLCRNTIAWCLTQIAQAKIMMKEVQKNELYWQMVGKAHNRYRKLCKRSRRTSHLNWTLIKEKNRQRLRQIKALMRAKKKQKQSEKIDRIKTSTNKALLPTPLNSPPTFFKSDKRIDPQHSSNLRLLEDFFMENKIRSYKIDGDMRCRRFMIRTLKSINVQDLKEAVSLFAQNTFLMDANAYGWLVARANALRSQGKEPWAEGKQLNRYQQWCPSITWFVRNISKILKGDYQPKEQTDSTIEKDSPHISYHNPLFLSPEQQIKQEAHNTHQHQAQSDRQAFHHGQTYWKTLDQLTRQQVEHTFIEAIHQGQTSLSPETNVHEHLFKIIKEVMLLTWLGYKMIKDQPEEKEI